MSRVKWAKFLRTKQPPGLSPTGSKLERSQKPKLSALGVLCVKSTQTKPWLYTQAQNPSIFSGWTFASYGIDKPTAAPKKSTPLELSVSLVCLGMWAELKSLAAWHLQSHAAPFCPNSEGLFRRKGSLVQQKVALTTTHLPQRPGYNLISFHVGETRAHFFSRQGSGALDPSLSFFFFK